MVTEEGLCVIVPDFILSS